MFVYGIGCSFRGWGICIRDGVLVYGTGCQYTGWGVSKRDGLLIYRMSSYIQNGALVNGMGYW